jgi:acyl carrier protein
MESSHEVIRRFITTNFYVADPAHLGDDESLLESGIIDSTGVLEIVAFLQQEFGMTVEDRDIRPENLDSVARLVAFVERSRATPAQATGTESRQS